MRTLDIRFDESGRELTIRGEPGFPVAIYDVSLESFAGNCVPWHWHPEVELILVREGRLGVEAGGRYVILEPGQGAFFNSGVLHRFAQEAPGTTKTVAAFDPLLISGAETSVLHTRYVLPLTQCRALPVICLTGEEPWHSEIAALMCRACDAEESDAFGHELAVRQLMGEIWQVLLRENRPLLKREAPERSDQRLKKMLEYLQSNLSEAVRLEDVAAAAGVSPRECTRCFHAALGITPIVYLTQLRVRAAAALLEGTVDSITGISAATGFESPGYFSRVFRRHTGLSPREYRRAKQAES